MTAEAPKYHHDFDTRALTWDVDPARRAMSETLASTIEREIPQSVRAQVLEVGCGTGFVGLSLAANAESYVGVDLSQGMLEKFSEKGDLFIYLFFLIFDF